MSPPVGAELVSGSYRWDQRCFGFFLRIPSVPDNNNNIEHDLDKTTSNPEVRSSEILFDEQQQHEVSTICSQTGGRVAVCTSLKQLFQHFDTLNNILLRPVVSVCMSPISVSSNEISSLSPPTVSPQLLAFPTQSSPPSTEFPFGNWPFPEDCVWTQGLSSLPTRTPQPLLRLRIVNDTHVTVDELPHFPYDKYTLESSPLTEWILAHRLEAPLLTVYHLFFIPSLSFSLLIVCLPLHKPGLRDP